MLAIKETPTKVRPAEDIAGLLLPTQALSLLQRLLPTWEEFRLDKAIHALRLWGQHAVFDTESQPSPFDTHVFTGLELLMIFMDHAYYKRVSRGSPAILTQSDLGVLVNHHPPQINFIGSLAHADK